MLGDPIAGTVFVAHKSCCFVSGQSLIVNYQISLSFPLKCVVDFISQWRSSTHDVLLLSPSFSEMNLMIVTGVINDFINVSFDL